MRVFCRLQEFKGTLDKRGGDQEGEIYEQVTGPSVCKCGIQKWPGTPTSRPNGHRTVNLNKRTTYCSLETGAPEDDALSSTATSSPAKKECDTQNSLSLASTVRHLPPQLRKRTGIHSQQLYYALRGASASFACSQWWSRMGCDLGGRSGCSTARSLASRMMVSTGQISNEESTTSLAFGGGYGKVMVFRHCGLSQ